MARKMKYTISVATLQAIITEGEHNATSGDVALASAGRRNVLLGTILLQLLSLVSADEFNAAKLATVKKNDLEAAFAEDALENENNKDDENDA